MTRVSVRSGPPCHNEGMSITTIAFPDSELRNRVVAQIPAHQRAGVDLVVFSDAERSAKLSRDDVDVVVLPYLDSGPTIEMLDELPNLRLVITQTTGYDPVAHLPERGIQVATASGVHTGGTAELALALTLASLRGIDDAVRSQVSRTWSHARYRSLQDRRVMVIGVGEIDRIDGLANVAGINDDFSPLHETSDAMWDRVIGVNLTGAFKLSRALIPVMLETGNASIVNVASEAGLRGNASGNAYTVSKHGVVGLTRSAAFMYGPQGIRVNAVAPRGVATGIAFPPNVSEAGAARLKPFQAQIPTIATAEQIAASITFLLSDDGVNINGVILPSDGGWSIQ